MPSNVLGVLGDPINKFLPFDFASGKGQKKALLLINICHQLLAVENKHGFQSRVGHPLVAIQERMIEDQRIAEGGGFFADRGVQLRTRKCHPGLRHCRLQTTKVSNPLDPSGNLDHTKMKFNDF